VPELRKRHAIINYDGRICIFGGLSGNKFYNDFHSFCYYSNMWRPVLKENNTVLPPPRVPFVFTEISNGNLLLFGGANETGFLSDAYLLVDFTWK
jgi:hypothetical protein